VETIASFHKTMDWIIEDEQCQRIGGGVCGGEVQIFTVSLSGANILPAPTTVQGHKRGRSIAFKGIFCPTGDNQ
jgi:hypothetical protein